MNIFGRIADELTDLIEEIENSPAAKSTLTLQRTLQRAFAEACYADRAERERQAASKLHLIESPTPTIRRVA